MTATTAFALAALAHLGFQATVTTLVYPALVRLGREHPDEWSAAHDRHSRGIVGLVAVLYGALLATGVWVLVTGVEDVATVVAGAGVIGAALATALGAAPTHGLLTRPEPHLLQRLIVTDRVRCGFAVVGGAAALVSVAS